MAKSTMGGKSGKGSKARVGESRTRKDGVYKKTSTGWVKADTGKSQSKGGKRVVAGQDKVKTYEKNAAKSEKKMARGLGWQSKHIEENKYSGPALKELRRLEKYDRGIGSAKIPKDMLEYRLSGVKNRDMLKKNIMTGREQLSNPNDRLRYDKMAKAAMKNINLKVRKKK